MPPTVEPTKLLLRREDVLRWTGISLSEFKKMVSTGTIVGAPLRPKGRAFYLKEHIRAVLITPLEKLKS